MNKFYPPYHLTNEHFANKVFGHGPKEVTKAILGLGIEDVCECETGRPKVLRYYDTNGTHPNRIRVCVQCLLPPGYIAVHFIFECTDCLEPFLNWEWPDKDSFICSEC